MFNLLTVTERYCQTFDWKKISLFKICCIAFGVAAGILIPEKHKKTVCIASLGVFILTYVPLMIGFISSCLREDEEMYY